MSKHSTQPKIGKLQPLPISKMPFQLVSIDFMTGFPRVGELDAIMVIVDRLTKWAAFIPCTKKVTADEVAQLFFDN